MVADLIYLTERPIDFTELTNSVRTTRAGAVVLFLGTVRDITGEVRTESLYYEAFSEMAVSSLQRLEEEARKRFQLLDVAISHRLGRLMPGEISVAIAVSSAHRTSAFDGGQWLINSLKEQVPVWKQELSPDGRSSWVHPGTEPRQLPDDSSGVRNQPRSSAPGEIQ